MSQRGTKTNTPEIGGTERDAIPSNDQRMKKSLDTQEEHCRKYAADHGYDIADLYREIHTGDPHRSFPRRLPTIGDEKGGRRLLG